MEETHCAFCSKLSQGKVETILKALPAPRSASIAGMKLNIECTNGNLHEHPYWPPAGEDEAAGCSLKPAYFFAVSGNSRYMGMTVKSRREKPW